MFYLKDFPTDKTLGELAERYPNMNSSALKTSAELMRTGRYAAGLLPPHRKTDDESDRKGSAGTDVSFGKGESEVICFI